MSFDPVHAEQLSVRHQVGEQVEIASGGASIARFRYGGVRRPHWHPLNLPDGRCVTLAQPHDHVWHSGLYHCPKFVDGYSLWEPEFHEARIRNPSMVKLDPDHHGDGRFGELVTRDVNIEIEPSHTTTTLRANVEWRTSEGRHLGDERQAWTFHSPTEHDPDAYVIELALRITARGNDRTLWAGKHGYSGLSWRSSRSMDRGTILNDRGETLDHDPRTVQANWVDYTGALDGLSERRVGGRLIGAAAHDDPDRFAGVTLMSHPRNSTSSFFTLGIFGYLSAHLGFPEPLVLVADQPILARYAIVVHAWRGSVERIAPYHERFISGGFDEASE